MDDWVEAVTKARAAALAAANAGNPVIAPGFRARPYMTKDEIGAAINALEMALQNNACLDEIKGHGLSGDNRDVPLRLTPAQTALVLTAVVAALKALTE